MNRPKLAGLRWAVVSRAVLYAVCVIAVTLFAGRGSQQSAKIRVAAHHAIQGHDVCSGDISDHIRKIRMDELHLFRMPAPRRLFPCLGQVCRRSIDMCGPERRILQQFMVDRPNASADIQERRILQSQRTHRFEDQARVPLRAVPAVGFDVGPGISLAEGLIGYFAAVASHLISPGGSRRRPPD